MHLCTIRPATPADAPGCAEVNLRAWHSAYRGLIAGSTLAKMNREELLKKWSWRLNANEKDVFCLVADANEKVLGYILCGKNRKSEFPFTHEVMSLYLLEEHWRAGIGRRLFLHAVDEFRKRDVKSFLVFVLEGNARARKFYESFKPTFTGAASLEIDGHRYAEAALGWHDIAQSFPA